MDKNYEVVSRRKPTGTRRTPLRVVVCDCGAMVAINKKGTLQQHIIWDKHRVGRTCVMSGKTIRCDELP